MVHARLTVADGPPCRRAVECQALARLQIFLRVFLFTLCISGDTQHLDVACERVVVACPGAIVRNEGDGFHQGRFDLRLEFRSEVCGERGKHVRSGRRGGSRFLRHVGTAHDRIRIEEPFTFERFGNPVARLLQHRFVLLCEGRSLFSADDQIAVGPIQVAKRDTQERFGAGCDHLNPDGAPGIGIVV